MGMGKTLQVIKTLSDGKGDAASLGASMSSYRAIGLPPKSYSGSVEVTEGQRDQRSKFPHLVAISGNTLLLARVLAYLRHFLGRVRGRLWLWSINT